MKYYTIVFPGEFGQHVQETWSEAQILKAYYPHWCSMMIQNVAAPDLNEKTCIDDWCVTHWAEETDEFGNKILPTNHYFPPATMPIIPPYTITCKLADGTTKDITLTSPVVAHNNSYLFENK